MKNYLLIALVILVIVWIIKTKKTAVLQNTNNEEMVWINRLVYGKNGGPPTGTIKVLVPKSEAERV